ncbi:DinB family protein [Mucilaginibacter terrigena]|uniref:DinB family protein n=1 Tax=Mucilaginibacter terrigena TaxID=2492395 RepID=A0A4Q5LKZ4_9SPHI|nr:DinB family protein [Mucilaginibacter terrigena]RYU90296.1 DinB family protein [Mucilaginibacter terrigena]
MKDEILNRFDKTTDELIELLAPLSDEQLNKVPFEDSWTAGQVGDHVTRSYDAGAVLNGNVKAADRAPDEKSAEVSKLFLDYTIKMESPKEILPTNDVINKDNLLASLKARIADLREVIINKDLTEICLDFAIPGFGEFTRMEWIGFFTVHTQRHIHQLKTIISKIK